MYFTIKKEHLNDKNEYVGDVDLSDFNGNIISDENLGFVKLKSIKVSGFILFKAGSGIKAGEGIEAGGGIEAGLSISAQIISTPLRIFAGLCLWRNPTGDEIKVRAKRICGGGVIAFGNFEKIE